MALMPKPATPRYRTTNWSDYNAALRRRGSLEIWFDPGMIWLATVSKRPGRPQRFSDSAIELCLTLKVLFGLALRQVTGLVASLLKLAKLDWPVPDYTTLCRRQKTLTVALCGRPSSGGLHLLVDSTGIKMMVKGNGRRASTVPPIVANGARCTWASMPKHWRSGRSRSPPTRLAMLRYCPLCSRRSRCMSGSPLSAAMALTIRRSAALPSLGDMPTR